MVCSCEMPNPSYYRRQAETLIRYAGVCEDADLADRLLSMAHEMLQKAERGGDDAESLPPHMIAGLGAADGEPGRD